MNKILFVDDEVEILNSMRRSLRKTFEVLTALGGKAGLETLAKTPDVAVVVSDYRMPEMNGVQFLSQVRQQYPDATRVLLTGQADQEATIRSINEGNIFRFLSKPCNRDELVPILQQCIRMHELVTAEKTLLERTLSGSIDLMLNMLSLARPRLFQKAHSLKQIVIQLYTHLQLPRAWSVELAAMFYYVGTLTLTDELLEKITRGEALDNNESTQSEEALAMTLNMLRQIPRLETVIKVIDHAEQDYTDSPAPGEDLSKYDYYLLGGQILKIAIALEKQRLLLPHQEILAQLQTQPKQYNAHLLARLETLKPLQAQASCVQASLDRLHANMVLEQDITNTDGGLLMAKGQPITAPIILRLQNLQRQGKIGATLMVSEKAK